MQPQPPVGHDPVQARRAPTHDEYFWSQNFHGSQGEVKIEEAMGHMRNDKIFALAIQETWKTGNHIATSGGFTVLHNGLTDKVCNRGSMGVAIVLGVEASKAWRRGGNQTFRFGNRIIAVRLTLLDDKSKKVNILFASAYAPDSSKTKEEIDEFYMNLGALVDLCDANETLICGADLNASVGIATSATERKVVGSFGIDYRNAAGTRLFDFCDRNELRLATTFFRKRSYASWWHPRNKKGYQLDHFLIKQRDHKRIINVALNYDKSVDSDHVGIKLKLRIARKLVVHKLRPRVARVDRTKLMEQPTCNPSCPEGGLIFREKLAALVDSAGGIADWSELDRMLLAAAPMVTSTRVIGWYEAQRATLDPLVKRRNAQRDKCNRTKCNRTKKMRDLLELRRIRKLLKRGVSNAKMKWRKVQLGHMETGPHSKAPITPAKAWAAIHALRTGPTTFRSISVQRFRKPDGTLAVGAENGPILEKHFDGVFNASANVDQSIFDEIDQHAPFMAEEEVPTELEIRTAIRKAGCDKSCGDSGVMPELLKAMVKDPSLLLHLRELINEFWNSPLPTKQWRSGRLKVLYKSGDASDPNRWRGIMLLDSVVKIVSSVISFRLQNILKAVGCEYQNGFTSRRGCSDGLFSIKIALQKRKEHELDTWLLFIDLVKAFDTVPRSSLFKVLAKYGVPPHLVSVIAALNTNCTVLLDVDGDDIEIQYTIGVKQGDNLAPVLFLFYIQAAIDTLEKKWTFAKPEYSTAEDDIFTGRNSSTRVTTRCRLLNAMKFYFWCSLYADDAAILFETKADLAGGSRLLFDHLRRFGLQMHVGPISNPKKSKSVFMYVHKASGSPGDGDRTPIPYVGGGVIPNVRKFKYLGSTIHESLNDKTDVADNIGKATGAFNLLKRCLFASRDVDMKSKVTFYEGLILALLLYASECWTTYASHLARLKRFHRNCVRTIAGVNRRVQWRRRITMKSLFAKTGLMPIERYIARRKLRWAGHVIRMDTSRLPRRFFSSWIEKPRKRYGQWLTWGHAIRKEMDRANLDRTQWSIQARDRACWRKGTFLGTFKPRITLEGREVEIFYESGEVRVHQPHAHVKKYSLSVETDEWFTGIVKRETTNSNGDIEIDVRHDDGVFRYVLKKWRWRFTLPLPQVPRARQQQPADYAADWSSIHSGLPDYVAPDYVAGVGISLGSHTIYRQT